MKVIFLDIDGVLNTEAWRNNAEDYFDKPICEEHMYCLRYLVERTGAKIVLSSTWREEWNEGVQQVDPLGDYFNKIFAKFGLEIFSKTPELHGDRKAEIESWIANHQVDQIERYVIIDDVEYDFDKDHFVKTTDDRGLDEEACEKAIKILSPDYSEPINIDEKWADVRAIMKDAVGDTTFNVWLKGIYAKTFFPDSKMLVLYCNSFVRRIITDSEPLSDVLDKAIREVFGEVEYNFEDEDIGIDNASILTSDIVERTAARRKIVYNPYLAYENPDVRAFKMREGLRRMVRMHPELIFKSKNTNYEMLFRVLLIFMNAGDLVGITDKIAVSRRNNHIEIYSNDCVEFLVDKAETEKHLFRNSDYDRFVIRNYDKKKRYLPAPFHIRSSVKGMGDEEDFYANIDSFFTLFSLANMVKNVRIESVKDGRYHCVKYERGINSKGIEEGETNKKNGTYITYTAPDEEELTNDEICDVLETVSILSGVKTSFFDPDKGDMLSYNYKNSGVYLDKCLPSKNKSFFSKVKSGGRDRYNDSYYNAKVEVGFQLAQSKGFSKSFFNYSLLSENNVFTKQVYKILAEKFNEWLEGKIMQRFSAEDIMRNCAIIISIKTDCDYEAWEIMRAEPVKARTMINDMIEDAFDSFLYWLEERDQVELINFIFKARDNDNVDMLFLDGMK